MIFKDFPRYGNSFFSIHHIKTTVIPGDDKRENFMLHNHQAEGHHEILVYLKGNSSFFAEGNIYPLNPGDIVFAGSNEFHNITHHSECEYERIVLHVYPKLFQQPGLKKFELVFTHRKPGSNNHIPFSSDAGKSLTEILNKMISYITQDQQNDLLIQNTFLNFLHTLNNERPESSKKVSHANVRKVILYIDEHITEDISLESIAKHFFMSKNYLCRVFKQHVGYTVNHYITKKRISLVGTMRKAGMPLMEAATAAGFNSYSSYYRAYRKETGSNPAYITPYQP